MRAILIVPAAAEALAAALACGAHALIVDWGGGAMAQALAERPAKAPLLYLRSHDLERDLPAMTRIAPHGIALSPCEGPRDVARLGARLAVEEAVGGLADGATGILAIVETARGALALPTLPGSSRRLAGIAWNAGTLRAEIGAEAALDRDHVPRPPLAQVRAMVRLAAAAAGIEAIDAACEAPGHLSHEIAEACRDGFAAKMALDPDQARAIALARPSEASPKAEPGPRVRNRVRE